MPTLLAAIEARRVKNAEINAEREARFNPEVRELLAVKSAAEKRICEIRAACEHSSSGFGAPYCPRTCEICGGSYVDLGDGPAFKAP